MIVLQIGIAIMAISVAALAVYTILLLRKAKSTLQETDLALAEVRAGMQRLSGEAEPLMRSACKLTDSMQERAASFDPMLGAVRQAGEAMRQATGSVRKLSGVLAEAAADVEESVRSRRSAAEDIADWAAIGIQLWEMVQHARREKADDNGTK
ncbi:DUF948 domain-containing protein [Paenibacillus sp. MBLB4367]|uniref:DUF948 domain-containing protein n=1 Tax=Paenibacillus sp. MBLB4367 TaxID=3384767 RepID=UPI0039083E25